MTEVIAVFDIGKTNKKVLLFDNRFKVVKQHEEKFPVISDDDGFECDDIDLITSWIGKCLEEIVTDSEYDLKGVNFSTYGASLVFLDENGQRLTPVYNYMKEIPESIAENLFEQYGGKNEFCRKTASPALGLMLNSSTQILWLKEWRPDVFQQTKSVLHFPQYLSYELSKEIVAEPTSIGCHTFMWDFDQMDYHQWINDHEIVLPKPINNDVVFPANVAGKEVKVGIGIHDSSASLVPYLKASPAKFILVSTGTWCINMNPYNEEPLTDSQLEQDCLCFLTPDKQQVKSSRLFMGHFHEVWTDKLAKHFDVETDAFKTVEKDPELMTTLFDRFGNDSVYFQDGKESFKEGLKTVDLNSFSSYKEAYTKLVIDLTQLCVTSINLVISEKDDTKILYVSGGFARNDIFIDLLKQNFPEKTILVSEIDNSSALGAAMVISHTIDNSTQETDLGILK